MAGRLEPQEDGEVLPFGLAVAELAPHAVGTASVLPKAIALPVLGGHEHLLLHEFVLAVREPAPPLVGAGS